MTPTQRKTTLALVLLLLIVGVGALLWFLMEHPRATGDAELEAPPEPVSVSLRLKWTLSAGFAGAIVADEKGFFLEEGLTVDIEPGGPGLDPVQLVASGADDFGITGSDRLLQARARGVPVVAIAMENRHSFATYIALVESEIEKAKDFEGRNVGVYRDDTYTVLQALLKKQGVPLESIKEVPLGYDLAPLLEGTVDVFSAYSINQLPKLDQMGVDYVVIDPQEYDIDFAGNVYFTSESFAASKPAAVEGFIEGLRRGWQYTFANPDKALDIVMATEPTLDREAESALLETLISELQAEEREVLSISPGDLEGTREVMMELGLLEQQPDLNAAVFER